VLIGLATACRRDVAPRVVLEPDEIARFERLRFHPDSVRDHARRTARADSARRDSVVARLRLAATQCFLVPVGRPARSPAVAWLLVLDPHPTGGRLPRSGAALPTSRLWVARVDSAGAATPTWQSSPMFTWGRLPADSLVALVNFGLGGHTFVARAPGPDGTRRGQQRDWTDVQGEERRHDVAWRPLRCDSLANGGAV
jgi:hypothetical protein